MNDERLRRLEERVAELSERLAAVERRFPGAVNAGAPGPEPAAPAGPEVEIELPPLASVAEVAGLAGRSCLILGGAFLLRALTEGGQLPSMAGLGLGFFYGLLWLMLAARAALGGRKLSAAFLGVTAVVIAYPLIWETSTRFQLLPPLAASVLVVLVTTGALAVGGRFGLRVTAWSATLAGIAVSFALLVQTHAAGTFTAALVVIGIETVVLAYVTRWHLLRWPAAVAADFAVLQLTALATYQGGPPAPYSGLSPRVVIVLALVLFLAYVVLGAGRALSRSRDLSAFEMIQSVAAFVVGFLGAVRVCRVEGGGCSWLAVLALVLAVAAYFLAFAQVDRREGRSRAFYLFLVEGLVLFVTGTWLLLPAGASTPLWLAAALVSAGAAARWNRVTLAGQAALLALLAAMAGGGLAFVRSGLLGTPAFPAWIALLAALAPALLYPVVDRFQPEDGRPFHRWPHALLAVLGAAGLLAFLVTVGVRLLGLESEAQLAPLRTVTGSLAAVVLAAVGARLSREREIGLLAVVALVLVGLKVLVVDLRVAPASLLVISLVTYGLALLTVPRFRRSRGE